MFDDCAVFSLSLSLLFIAGTALALRARALFHFVMLISALFLNFVGFFELLKVLFGFGFSCHVLLLMVMMMMMI